MRPLQMDSASHRQPEPVSYERVGNALAGASVLVTVALGHFCSPWWLLGTAAICLNLIVTAIANRCPVKSLLSRLGMVGERDLGRAEVLRASAATLAERSGRRGAEGLAAPRKVTSRLGVNLSSVRSD